MESEIGGKIEAWPECEGLPELEAELRRRRRHGTLEPFRSPDAYAEECALRME